MLLLLPQAAELPVGPDGLRRPGPAVDLSTDATPQSCTGPRRTRHSTTARRQGRAPPLPSPPHVDLSTDATPQSCTGPRRTRHSTTARRQGRSPPSPPLPTWTCLQTLHRSPVPDRGGPVTVPLPDGKVGPLPPLPSPRGPVYRRYTAVLYRTEADPSQYHCQTAR